MRPVFATSGLRDNGMGRRVGAEQSHLKLNILEGSNPKTYNGIAFGLGEKYKFLNKIFKIAFTIDQNHWNGTTSIQLKIKDIKEE
jgi:single-stranded-DNA-specific exonuclease